MTILSQVVVIFSTDSRSPISRTNANVLVTGSIRWATCAGVGIHFCSVSASAERCARSTPASSGPTQRGLRISTASGTR
jgi:hypothetical protein